MDFKVYTIKQDFYNLFSIQEHIDFNLKTKTSRPYLIIENPKNENLTVIPFSTNTKRNRLDIKSIDYPDFYMKMTIEDGVDSYLVFQNLFVLKREYVNKPFKAQNLENDSFVIEITDEEMKKEITRRIKRVVGLMKGQTVNNSIKISFANVIEIFKKQ